MSKFRELINMKLETFPTWEDARIWSNFRLSGGPMNTKDYNEQVRISSQEIADHLLTLTARTTLAWYLDDWYSWLTFWDLKSYGEHVAMSEGYGEGDLNEGYGDMENWPEASAA